MHKLARVVSYLAAAEQRPIQGAITRAFAPPALALARAALLQIYTQLKSLSCSAALRLLQDLDRSLTFHQSGVYDRLSGSRARYAACCPYWSSSRIGVHAETGFRLPRVVPCLHFCCRRWKCACTDSRMLRFILDAKWKHTGKNENNRLVTSTAATCASPTPMEYGTSAKPWL